MIMEVVTSPKQGEGVSLQDYVFMTSTTEEIMKLKCLFPPLPPSVPRHGEKDKRKMRRDAARLASSGNVLVQQGLFVTKEEIDRRKKRLLEKCCE